MKYVIDKNTNRIIYMVPEGGKYLLDKHLYLVESDPLDLAGFKCWHYKWNGAEFKLDAKHVKVPTPTKVVTV